MLHLHTVLILHYTLFELRPNVLFLFYALLAEVSPQIEQHCGDILQTRVPIVYSQTNGGFQRIHGVEDPRG